MVVNIGINDTCVCHSTGHIYGIGVIQPATDLKLVLPPAPSVWSDFFFLHERLVYREGQFNMELIVGGSRHGFRGLANYFRQAAEDEHPDVDNHWHVDMKDTLRVMPSVFLNIRGPVVDIAERLATLAPPSKADLPPDMNWRTTPESWAYEPVKQYPTLYGRIPVKGSC